MDRINILYLIDVLYGYGGAECALLRTVRLLPKSRYQCSIGTFRLGASAPLLRDAPCPIIELPMKHTFGPAALRSAIKLNDFIRSERVDIVHTFFQSADLWGGVISKLSGCPVLVSGRRDMGILLTTKHRIAYRLLRPLFDQIQAVSDSVREHAIKAEGFDPMKVITIPNGVDIDQIKAAKQSSKLRNALNVDSKTPLIVTVGNIRRVKGVDILIRALSLITSSHPNALLLVVGSVNEPEYYQELKELTADLHLQQNVRFLGKSDEICSILKACDVFCLPSRSEGMSNALLEAMACGLPCVATAVGGTPEVVADGESGFLVANEDVRAIAARILRLLGDSHLAQRIGIAGTRRVEQHFSAQRMVEDMARSYEAVLAARRGERMFRSNRALRDFEPSENCH